MPLIKQVLHCRFFLFVGKTSCGCLTFNAFFTPFKTGTCIPKALQVFREWNNDLIPENWMVDYGQAERNVLNKCCPECIAVLCDFHREQASEQGLQRTGSDVPSKDAVLTCLRKLFNAKIWASLWYDFDMVKSGLYGDTRSDRGTGRALDINLGFTHVKGSIHINAQKR